MEYICPKCKTKYDCIVECNLVCDNCGYAPLEKVKDFVRITDCIKKEELVISRKGGDLELRFINRRGWLQTPSTIYWFEIKNHSKRNFEKILEKFEEIKALLIQ